MVQETSFAFDTSKETTAPTAALLETLPADQYPHLAEMATEYLTRPRRNYAEEFEFGLDLILDGLEIHRNG